MDMFEKRGNNNMYGLKAPKQTNDLVKLRSLSDVNNTWEKLEKNFPTMIDGLPFFVKLLEVTESFPLFSQLRLCDLRKTSSKGNIVKVRETRKHQKTEIASNPNDLVEGESLQFQARLPNFAGDDTIHLCENTVRQMFVPSMVERVVNKNRRNRYIHVRYEDYNSLMGPYVFRNDGDELEYWYYGESDLFYEGKGDNAIAIKHVRFSSVSYLRRELESAIRRGGRKNTSDDLATVVLLPSRSYWAIKLNNQTTSKEEVRRVRRQWVNSRIMVSMLHRVVTKSGEWHTLERMDIKSIFNRVVENTALTAQDKEVRAHELGENYRGTTVGGVVSANKQISHLMFKKYQKGLKEVYWKELQINANYIYDCKKGWFFGFTFDNRREVELIELAWIRENFNKSFVASLMRNHGVFWQVPVGHSRQQRSTVNKAIPIIQIVDATIAEEGNLFGNAATSKRKRLRMVDPDNREIAFRINDYPVLKEVNDMWPSISFQQGDKELCMFYSFASALKYMGLTRVAAMVRDQAARSLRLDTLIERTSLLETTIKRYQPDLFVEGSWSLFHQGKLDLVNNQQKAPTLAVLMSVDGAVNHAVTVFDKWIFDANEERAMPICKEALNRAAPPGFKEVLLAFRYGKGKCDMFPT